MIFNESEKKEMSCSPSQLIRTGTGYADMTEACHSPNLCSVPVTILKCIFIFAQPYTAN